MGHRFADLDRTGVEIAFSRRAAGQEPAFADDAVIWHLHDLSVTSVDEYRQLQERCRDATAVNVSTYPFPGGYVQRFEWIWSRPGERDIWSPGMQISFLDDDGRVAQLETYFHPETLRRAGVIDATAVGGQVTSRPRPTGVAAHYEVLSWPPKRGASDSPHRMPPPSTQKLTLISEADPNDVADLGVAAMRSLACAQLGRVYAPDHSIWQGVFLRTYDESGYGQISAAFGATYPALFREHSYIFPFVGGVLTRNELTCPTPDGTEVWTPGAQLTFYDANGDVVLLEEYMNPDIIQPLGRPAFGDQADEGAYERPQPPSSQRQVSR